LPGADACSGSAPAIRSANEAAFGGQEEADLGDKLRASGEVQLSLVAELDDRIVGHILFSRMWIETPAHWTGLIA
jgi:putative acetyltransferase